MTEWWPIVAGIFVAVFTVLGVIHALQAIMSVRTSQGTIAWVVSLVTFPFVAVPLYWIFGRNKFQGYVESRRTVDEKLRKTVDVGALVETVEAMEKPDDPLLRVSAQLGGLPIVPGNQVELLINGAEGFESMLATIGLAREYILIEFFIVKADRVGQAFKDALVRKAREGVEVYLLYDEVGSRKLPDSYIDELVNAGASCTAFGANRGAGNRLQINFRNHRKILVADGKTAYVGGLNLGVEYLGKFAGLGDWRDTHLRITGPSALAFQHVFIEDWYWARREIPPVAWKVPDPLPGKREVLVVPTGPADPLESCQLLFASFANAASERLWIASPYFVPDVAAVAVLQAAALRGVDVRILLPGKPDQILVYLSSFSYYREMMRAGVRIFRYTDGFLHQKVWLVDNHLAAVGTANLDNRSFRLNFEVMAVVPDKEFAAEVKEMLQKDLGRSEEAEEADYSGRPLWFRAACRLSRLLAPIQ